MNAKTLAIPAPSFVCSWQNPALQSRFLKSILLTQEDIDFGFLILPDGSEWNLYLEGEALARYIAAEAEAGFRIPCVCSFQHWATATESVHRVVCRKQAPRAAIQGE